MRFSILALAGLLPGALSAAVAVESRAAPATELDFALAASNYNFTADFAPALSYALSAISAIPDDVLASNSDAALDAWLVANHYRTPGGLDLTTTTTSTEIEARGFWKATKCVASIMWAIGSTAIPIAKIAKIKKYIEALGGVKKAVELMLGATSKAEKLKAGGQALVSLSAELLGIASVKSNCF
ncbi:hypothetical protein ISF_07240 [Cordyceps fumosorosea ARSEF 2679]|uniref:Cell wall galactomannoprotein n=1 Tax=Cordyceps fumosorosea (strain ARSEF 2679) TaxID=1081104 RepID=A0A167Q5R1_CORFA|nr:hypothetical protein ISF_07240 [Cordyceps fumosorosea ARSEF 2679]OAA57319.1 hypothetical protein ISF_07240 [Cordyceps fumosorosea ARSEF 2679]